MPERRKVTDLFQSHLQNMKAYTAIDPPEILAARLGISASEIIKLDGNEFLIMREDEVLGILVGKKVKA